MRGRVTGSDTQAILERDRVEHSRTPPQASVLGCEQFPVPLRNDVDGAVGHLEGGLVSDRVRRSWHAGGPPFGGRHRVPRQVRVLEVGEDREGSTIPRVRSSGADGPRAAPTVALRTASQIEGLVMGGGFGGAIVALAEAEAAPSLVDAVSAASAKRTGREP